MCTARAANRNQLSDVLLDIAEHRGLDNVEEWLFQLELGDNSDHLLPANAKVELGMDLNVLINALYRERRGQPTKEISAAN